MSTTIKWTEIGRDEFHDIVGQLNVHPQSQPEPYPYTSIWKTPCGIARGKTVDFYIEGERTHGTLYYIPSTDASNSVAIYNTTVECKEPVTGKIGCWLFNGKDHRVVYTRMSPVFADLADLFKWLNTNGYREVHGTMATKYARA